MSYTLGKRERTNFLDERGRGTDGYRVYFRMEDGTVDYIEIEKGRFNPEAVHEEIEKAIALHGALAVF